MVGTVERSQLSLLRSLVSEHLSPYYDTDFNLARWLQGHNGMDIEDIAQRLRNHLKMRSSVWTLDEMATKPRDHPIHRHWRFGITGESTVLDNVIVNIEQEVMRARCKDLEDLLAEVMKLEKKTGRQASVLYVMDLSGLRYDKNLYSLVTGAMRSLSEFMATHYVEMIKYFVLVNVPAFVYGLWTIVKPLLPERTRQKVRILSSQNWRTEILEYASADSLPSKWNTDENNVFSAQLDLPVPFPIDEYYINRSDDNFDGLEEFRITAGKSERIIRKLQKGDRLHWVVFGYADFGFAVFFSPNNDQMDISQLDVVYPNFEWMPGPSQAPLNDHCTAPADGSYIIWMSNERAWWYTLRLRCRFTVVQNCD